MHSYACFNFAFHQFEIVSMCVKLTVLCVHSICERKWFNLGFFLFWKDWLFELMPIKVRNVGLVMQTKEEIELVLLVKYDLDEQNDCGFGYVVLELGV